MRIRKELNLFNSVNQKIPYMEKGEKKEQRVIKSIRKEKANKIIEISKYLLIITLNVNGHNIHIKDANC
jgi:hypothetical protein